jgi:hypothetical protein
MNAGKCLPLAAIVGEDEMISSVIPLDQQELAEQKDDEIKNRGVLHKLFFDDSFPFL